MSIKCVFLSLLTFFFADQAFAQCNLEKTFSVETSQPQGDFSKIVLTVHTVPSQVHLKLYDIMVPNFQLIEERDLRPASEPVQIKFENLKAGTYSIIASWGNCTETIGGISGIRIDKTDKK